MDTLSFLSIFAGALALVWLGAVVVAYRRSRMAPMCWHCGAWKVKETRGLARDFFALMSLMVPLRCGGCLVRFYGLRGVRPKATRPVWQTRERATQSATGSGAAAFLCGMFLPGYMSPVVKVRFRPPLSGTPKREILERVEFERSPVADPSEQISQDLSALSLALAVPLTGKAPRAPKPRRRRKETPLRTATSA